MNRTPAEKISLILSTLDDAKENTTSLLSLHLATRGEDTKKNKNEADYLRACLEMIDAAREEVKTLSA